MLGVFVGVIIGAAVLGGVLLRVVYDFGNMVGDGAIFFSLRHSLQLVDWDDVADESSSYWLESPWFLEWKACQDRSFIVTGVLGSWWLRSLPVSS